MGSDRIATPVNMGKVKKKITFGPQNTHNFKNRGFLGVKLELVFFGTFAIKHRKKLKTLFCRKNTDLTA